MLYKALTRDSFKIFINLQLNRLIVHQLLQHFEFNGVSFLHCNYEQETNFG